MRKTEFILSFLLFSVVYLFTSVTISLPVFADNHTNMTNTTHLECINRACVPVNNTLNNTVDRCRNSADCDYVQAVRANRTISINLTHLECVNQACVRVNGTGIDSCQTNAQCNLTNMTHRACVNLACVLVNNTINGTNIDECIIDLDCNNNTGGGNGSNGSGGGGGGGGGGGRLPLAPPIQPAPEQPRTLASIIWRAITSIF